MTIRSRPDKAAAGTAPAIDETNLDPRRFAEASPYDVVSRDSPPEDEIVPIDGRIRRIATARVLGLAALDPTYGIALFPCRAI